MTNTKQNGFTLIEILVVVIIIGVLATMVGPNIVKTLFRGNVSSTQSNMAGIKAALVEFKMDMGRFPTKQEGLHALVKNVPNSPKWQGPYLEGKTEVPLDAWQFEFIYNNPPEVFKDRYKSFEIISYGEEGEGADQSKWLHTGA